MTRFLGFGKKGPPAENQGSTCVDNDALEDINGLSNLYSPEEDSATQVRDVANVLQEMGKITAEQLSEIRQHQVGKPDCEIEQVISELNFADDLDSSVAAFQRIMAKEKEPGRVWSNYVNLIDRFIYFGQAN